ncbi:hypothetical protein [Pseudomonas koreensis]|uniref:hypothetical protein n=1 Tax=Pseudomonas koreensis TaxID=198620 RepID=UPI001475250E|nr:hypothetical protein [Pseudomonas koreensis]NNA56032.1 hypothetical protein [Pseudomonas koreensis]
MGSKYFLNSAQAAFFLVLPLIGACSFAGQMAKDSVEGATSYYSREHFTLIATVPAKFGFTSKAQYSPKHGETCQVYSSGLGGSVTRQQQKSNTIDAKDIEQTVSTDVPLEFHIADCSMELTRVSYEVNATYGSDAWDHGLEMAGGLSVQPSTTDNGSQETLSIVEQRSLCLWLFQISKSKAKFGEIEKILSCYSTDESWAMPKTKYERRKPGGSIARSVLANKTIKIEFRLSEQEYPAVGDTWQKFPEGWKPCFGKGPNDPYGFCQGNSESFKKFRMNGRECTVYPGCN